MQPKLYPFLSVFSLLVTACAAGTPNPIAGSSKVACRDPATIYGSESKKYYTFCTGEGVKFYTAPAITGPWKKTGRVMPKKCANVKLQGHCGVWAADVAKIDGQYVLYYSVSTVGSANAVVGVATSKTMEPGTWKDHGEVIRSNGSKGFIAIDPNVIKVNNTIKLQFGSHMDGLFQIDMKDFKTPKSKLPGKKLAGYNGRPHMEGGFMYKSPSSPYYFYFFSDGITLFDNGRPAAGDEYMVRVGRSKSPSGPFKDKSGNDLTKKKKSLTGTIVLRSHDNVYAPGGQSLFRDPVSKRDVIAYHYVSKKMGGGAKLGLNYVDFRSGWPKIVNWKPVKPSKSKPKRLVQQEDDAPEVTDVGVDFDAIGLNYLPEKDAEIKVAAGAELAADGRAPPEVTDVGVDFDAIGLNYLPEKDAEIKVAAPANGEDAAFAADDGEFADLAFEDVGEFEDLEFDGEGGEDAEVDEAEWEDEE
ncbi:Arabinanase/levansucrase/invertase [Auricularia subglabra TFB-10046 SS5]|nr:Arabinanase/levansucrase/invertase [Auricularia subglabra TFB-10046 SS5]